MTFVTSTDNASRMRYLAPYNGTLHVTFSFNYLTFFCKWFLSFKNLFLFLVLWSISYLSLWFYSFNSLISPSLKLICDIETDSSSTGDWIIVLHYYLEVDSSIPLILILPLSDLYSIVKFVTIILIFLYPKHVLLLATSTFSLYNPSFLGEFLLFLL